MALPVSGIKNPVLSLEWAKMVYDTRNQGKVGPFPAQEYRDLRFLMRGKVSEKAYSEKGKQRR